MACDLWREKLDAYVDGELPVAEMAALDQHLRQCPACAADAVAVLHLKRVTKLSGQKFAPTSEFQAKIEGLCAPRRRRWAWRPLLATAFVLLLVAVLAIAYLTQRASGESAARELADLHITTLASTSPVDVVSSDRHTVKPWFQGRIPFTFNLPELQGTDYALLGGRVVYLGRAPVAQLLFQYRQHKISAFILQNSASPLRWSSHVPGDFTSDSWVENGLRYFIVSDAGPAEIHQLDELLRNAAHQK
jgi:anti-sigma factor RsiW